MQSATINSNLHMFKIFKKNKESEFAIVAISSGNVTATFCMELAMNILTCNHL